MDIGCNSAATGLVAPVSIPLFSPMCGTSLDVLATVHDAEAVPAAYAVALGVPVTGGSATVTLGPWQAFDTLSLSVRNAPAASELLQAVLQPQRNGTRFPRSGTAAGAALVPGGSASLSLPFPRTFTTSARRTVTVLFSEPRGRIDGSAQHLVNEAPCASASLDLGTALPPRLRGLRVTNVSGAPVATWQQVASDPTLDGAVLSARWTVPNREYDWEVLMPPNRTSFTFPQLPAELDAFRAPADAILDGASVTAYNVSDIESYAAFKRARTGFLRGLPESGSYSVRSTTTFAMP